MPAAARKVALTDRSMKALKPAPAGKRTVVWDSLMPGMAVRVTDKGRISFVAVRRRPGQVQPTWAVLGQYPIMSLAEAREAARDALKSLAKGQDPRVLAEERRQQEEQAARQQQASSFGAISEEFISKHLPRLRSARAAEALIRRELIPVLGDKPIGAIRTRDIIALIEAIGARGATHPGRARPVSGGEHAARHALAQLRKLFSWALARDIEGLDASPVARVKVATQFGESKPRDRVLTDDEIRTVWRAAEQMGGPFGTLCQTLLLSGQRLNELARAHWGEIDLDKAILTVPAERMKGKAAHTVPLTPAVVALLATMPRFAGGDFVFSTTGGRRPVSGFSKAKARLDKVIGEMAHWTLHDLRRTARTGLAEVGAAPFIAELVIGHRQTGVHGVYDLHRYDAEKRAALEAWEARLLTIVAPTPENVVTLQARVRA